MNSHYFLVDESLNKSRTLWFALINFPGMAHDKVRIQQAEKPNSAASKQILFQLKLQFEESQQKCCKFSDASSCCSRVANQE